MRTNEKGDTCTTDTAMCMASASAFDLIARTFKYGLIVMCMLLIVSCGVAAHAEDYEPTWESLDSRPMPQWYDDAKFGIFIHWGVYSVPSWARKGQYSEWYWKWLENPSSPEMEFHRKVYGKDFEYQDFAPMFRTELFNPDEWASIFERSGAKYVVLTSKHHDGFALFPSKYSWNWNSMDVGPHRDLVGDLAKSVRAAGLKMGLYYSLYEWYHPFFEEDGSDIMKYLTVGKDKRKSGDRQKMVTKYVEEHMLPQMTEVIKAYEPSVLWTDGEWSYEDEVWQSRKFLTWLYNKSAVRDEIVVNDRWGKETRSRHGGFYTSEYGSPAEQDRIVATGRKWEENRGIGASFGYNRNESLDEYNTADDLIDMLVHVVSRGGNLLLDIGPTADGRIPVIMQQRLAEIGEWLDVNGEAIYETKPWRVSIEGENIRYTAKGGTVFAIVLKWPGKELALENPEPSKDAKVTMPGYDGDLDWRVEGGKMIVTVPQLSVEEVPCRHAFVFKLTGIR